MFDVAWRKILSDSSSLQAGIISVARLLVSYCARYLTLTCLLLVTCQLHAAQVTNKSVINFNIPAQRADLSLIAFAEQSDQTLVFPFDEAKDKKANSLVGSYPIYDALERLLKGTGLQIAIGEQGQLSIISQHVDSGDVKLNKSNRTNSLLGNFGAAFLSLLTVLQAGAEDAVSSNTTDFAMEEIIVTAQKREASLQSTPIAITAITAGMIENAQIDDIRDINQLAPSLTYNQAPAGLQLYIRGVGQDAPTVGNSPGVAIYVDGVYQGQQFANTATFQDIERIEVLRGPQGTLYGRNSTGGNINIISKQPDFDPSFKLGITGATYNTSRVNLVANGGLIDDTLAVRASLAVDDRDGYRTNLFNGKDMDYARVEAGTLAMLYTPADNIEWIVRADYQESHSDGRPMTYAERVIGSGFSPLAFGGKSVTDDASKLYHDTPDSEVRRFWGVNGTLTWDLDDLQVKSITSFRESTTATSLDSDGTNIPFVIIESQSESDELSQEIDLLGSAFNDAMEWIVGASYYRNKAATTPYTTLPFLTGIFPAFPPINNLSGEPTTIIFVDSAFQESLVSIGAFAQATYSISDKLRTTLGIRFTRDEKDNVQSSVSNLTPPADHCRALPVSKSWTSPTYKVGVDYDLSETLMTYGSVSRGFKAGGFNAGRCNDSFDEEIVTAYEIGVKSNLLDRRLVLNGAAYFYDYTDMQVRSFLTDHVEIDNAAESTIYGLELEFVATPAAGLQFDGGINLQRGEYDTASLDDPMVPGIALVDISGNRLLRSPDLKVNVGVQYTMGLASGGSLQARYDAAYTDDYYVDPFENSFATIESHTIQNLRLTWRNMEDNLFLQLFVENLTDEEHFEWKLSAAAVGGTSASWAPPRVFGLRLNYSN